MSVETTSKDLAPSNKILREAMLRGLDGRVSEQDVNNFIEKTTSGGAPALIPAKASVIFAGIYGNVSCDPTSMPWNGSESIWGLGAKGGSAIGVIYTVYHSWDDFFRYTTGFHVQGIAKKGGILQINWFEGKGDLIGQYNGALAGLGGLQGGGHWRWKRASS